MIYDALAPGDPIDQGDLIEGCPVLSIAGYDLKSLTTAGVRSVLSRVVVLTQTCDLANDKAVAATVAEVLDAQFLVDQKVFKAADVKGSLRGGRIWGWYFLPAADALGLGEMIIDLRRVHTVRLDLLRELCASGQRKGRARPLYREHLAKHFADTFSRIGLPRPYETM
jgi:hypothetical protein